MSGGRVRFGAALVVALALGAGGAAAQLQEAAGRYEFTASLGERTMSGVIELGADRAAPPLGELRLGGLPPAAVDSVDRTAAGLRLVIRIPEGAGTATLRLRDDGTFDGEIRVAGNTLPIEGRRTRVGPPAEVRRFLPAVRGRVRDLAPSALAEAEEAGLAVAAVEADSAWVRGFGVADRETGQPVTASTAFQVGSISKLLTAWGVMRLVDAGAVELDAPVNRYLRRWTLSGGDFDADGATVRRLLSHTAGVNVPSIAGVDLDEPVPDLVAELNGRGRGDDWRVRIVEEPGVRFVYSGGGYMVLQLLIEDVTGVPFAEWMRENVLAPLGMTGSAFGWSDDISARVATPYSADPERDRRHRLFAGLAGAGLYTTAADMERLIAAHFAGPNGEAPGRGVVRPETLREMTTPDPVAQSYGLGYEIHRLSDGALAVGHGGSNIGWKANVLIVPERGVGFAVLSNSDEGRARAVVLEAARDVVGRMGGS